MNDDFLNVLRRELSPDFAHKLKMRLREFDVDTREPKRIPRVARWGALAASLVAVVLAFTFPAVRAGAQAFLDLFRVVSFTGVTFDPERLTKLQSSGLDLAHIMGGEIEVLKEPHPPVAFATVEEAGSAAGLHVRTPTSLPTGYELNGVNVAGNGEVRFTANTLNVRLLLDSLAISDVTIPDGIDGKEFRVRVPPMVQVTYGALGRPAVMLIEARTPEMWFPAGLDVAALGEIGLRILGLSRSEAYLMAQSIDWRTTLLVPVPVNAASFRHVNIQGETALLIQVNGADRSTPRLGGNAVLLWSHQGVVYQLTSALGPDALVNIAQSFQ
jgi:hypothetical protein